MVRSGCGYSLFLSVCFIFFLFFFFQAEDGIRDGTVTGVQTCALPIFPPTGELAHASSGDPPATPLSLMQPLNDSAPSPARVSTAVLPMSVATVSVLPSGASAKYVGRVSPCAVRAQPVAEPSCMMQPAGVNACGGASSRLKIVTALVSRSAT